MHHNGMQRFEKDTKDEAEVVGSQPRNVFTTIGSASVLQVKQVGDPVCDNDLTRDETM